VRLRRRRVEPLRLEAPPALLEWRRRGPAPLERRRAGDRLRVAFVIPWFFEGSGGHSTIANLVRGLEARGHACSLWLEGEQAGDAQADFEAWFGPVEAPLRAGFEEWGGADVAVATGWQTVHRTLLLDGVAARAYLVQDHEPEFYGTSAERTWAEETYRLGLHCVCASPWLAGVMRERYGASASHFDLGVRHDVYRPLGSPRRDDLVVLYARAVTPRRAVPLGLLALEEVRGAEVALFGEGRPIATRFRQLGVLAPDRLARLYAEATVGVVLSMTNPSLVPTEMLACGLPVVDVASEAMVATFGRDGPIALAAFDPLAVAGEVNRLLADPGERARRAQAGVELVRGRTWAAAAEQVESGLRAALLD
jgi:glycosyltransferase involved in cell wall biosynthesis